MISQEKTYTPVAVCTDHLTDAHLLDRIGPALTSGRCSFCARSSRSRPIVVDLRLLASIVMDGVAEKYEQKSHYRKGISAAQAIEEVCSGAVEPPVVRAVKSCADPGTWHRRDTRGEGTGPAIEPWPMFRDRIQHEQRFTLLSGPARIAMLDMVSAVIEQLELIRMLPAGHQVWRGRMHRYTSRPGFVAATIGTAPRDKAAANRMSPAGVSVFYGSADVTTAVAEISAHDPRPYAAVAAFELTRPIAVIDLAHTLRPPSVFHPQYRSLLGPVEFIRAFSADMSKPVRLDGREHSAYVPTQLLTEYFRWLSPLQVEGIVFRSSQNDGINYGLFTGPEGCVDAHAVDTAAMLRLQPQTELVVDRIDRPKH